MYNIAVSFDIAPEHRDDFIAAALEDGRESAADEPGTRRFELITDEADPNHFYLNEAYADISAFQVHSDGPHFARFFEKIAPYAKGPNWLIRGTRVEDHSSRTATANELGLVEADHVALRVGDYDESLRFYTETLGFELETEWTLGDAVPGVRFAYVKLGNFKIELIGDGGPEPLPETNDVGQHLSRSGYIHLCLHVDSVDATVAKLRERGVAILAEPFEVAPINKRLAMVKDNSGNVIELCQDIPA